MTMLLDPVFPALLAARLRRRLTAWPMSGSVQELDEHLRRDIGLSPRIAPASPIRPDWR